MMTDDPVIKRIQQIRHRISEECNHDPQELIHHYMELERNNKSRFLDTEKIIHREEPLTA